MSDIRKLSPRLAHSLHPTQNTTATFTSYRFILISCRAQSLSWVSKSTAATAPGDSRLCRSTSPSVTSCYTGTLVFSHHTCDLDTAFAILCAAMYLSLPQLYDNETQAHVVYEMLHGLYHAFLQFEEYERITGANWGTGLCHCRQCASRVPCALEFALADDVANKYLDHSVVGHCWVCSTTDNTVRHNRHTPPCTPYYPSVHDLRSNATRQRSSMQPCRAQSFKLCLGKVHS
ncbi:hypothetical protein BDN67DRAFT_562652 [Paxillus ammoniavirescens]|nr:hypothetical protein BDN67DRAFT_562652 [Paxillus ammoniavirescens]